MTLRGRGLSTATLVGGVSCLAITVLMNRHVGALMGATVEGAALLSSSAVAIEVVGICVMGMVAVAFARHASWWVKALAILPAIVWLASTAVCISSITNFVAAERLSVDRARKEQEADIKRRRDRADEAAKERQRAAEKASEDRLRAQQDLAKTQLGFMQAQVREAGKKDRKVLQKGFAGEAAKIIGEIGKAEAPAAPAPEAAAAPEPVIIVRSESGVELIADITGLDQRSVLVMQMGALAVLLIVIEALCFPAAALLWPHAGEATVLPEVLTALKSHFNAPEIPPPVASPLLIESAALPAIAPPAASDTVVPAPPPLPEPMPEPRPARTPLPGAEASLRGIGFPLDGKPPGPQRERQQAKVAAQRFLVWARAYGLADSYSPARIEELLTEFCVEDHREKPATTHFLSALADLHGVRKRRPIVDGVKSSNNRYEISPGKYRRPKPDEQPQQGAQVVRPEALFFAIWTMSPTRSSAPWRTSPAGWDVVGSSVAR